MVCMVQPWAEGRLDVMTVKYILVNVVLMFQTTLPTAAGTNCHDIQGCPELQGLTTAGTSRTASSLTARSPCCAFASAVS
jgi:hypothetical protein